MTRRGNRTPRGGGTATARVTTGQDRGRPSERVAPRFAGPDAAAPGQRRTEPMRGAPPSAPAPENGQPQPSAFKRRLRHRPTPRPLAGPGGVHRARTAGKDGAPAFVGPDAPPGRAAFAAHPSGGDAAAGGVAANASPALGRAPGAGVGFRTKRRGGYATAGRAARGVPATRRERLAGLPPGRASGPALSVRGAHQRVAARTRRNGGAVVSLRSLRRSDAALAGVLAPDALRSPPGLPSPAPGNRCWRFRP